MIFSRCTLPLVVAVCSLLVVPAWAGEGFSLNPFAKKKTTTAKFDDDGPGATTIPAAGGGAAPKTTEKLPKKTSNQPSTWQKFNAGTQTFFAKSKGVLMPWSKSKPAKPPAKLTGTTKVYDGSASAKKPAAKKSMFESIFGGGETKEEPSTVEDFIGQPRPPF